MDAREQFAKDFIQGGMQRGYSRDVVSSKLSLALADWDKNNQPKQGKKNGIIPLIGGVLGGTLGGIAGFGAGGIGAIPGAGLGAAAGTAGGIVVQDALGNLLGTNKRPSTDYTGKMVAGFPQLSTQGRTNAAIGLGNDVKDITVAGATSAAGAAIPGIGPAGKGILPILGRIGTKTAASTLLGAASGYANPDINASAQERTDSAKTGAVVGGVIGGVGSATQEGVNFFKDNNILNRATGKMKEIVAENKNNNFLKNLNLSPNKNNQYSAEEEAQAVALVKKKFGTTLDSKQYRDAIQSYLDSNRKAALSIMGKPSNTVSMKIDEFGNLKDEGLQTLADKMVKGVPNDRAGNNFKNMLAAKMNALLESGKGNSKVLTGAQQYSLLDDIGSNMKDIHLTKAEQGMWRNAYNALKNSLPKEVVKIRETNNILRTLIPGLNTATNKITRNMTGDTLTTIKKIVPTVIKGGGLVGTGLAAGGILGSLKGQ